MIFWRKDYAGMAGVSSWRGMDNSSDLRHPFHAKVVIPAKAGIQEILALFNVADAMSFWIPASAGMTG